MMAFFSCLIVSSSIVCVVFCLTLCLSVSDLYPAFILLLYASVLCSALHSFCLAVTHSSALPASVLCVSDSSALHYTGFLWISVLYDAVGPEMWENGVNRSDFEDIIWDRVEEDDAIPEERKVDVFEASNFYYSPWPHINDPHENMHQLGEVKKPFNSVNCFHFFLKYGRVSDNRI